MTRRLGLALSFFVWLVLMVRVLGMLLEVSR
jgi:hypothetical protein